MIHQENKTAEWYGYRKPESFDFSDELFAKLRIYRDIKFISNNRFIDTEFTLEEMFFISNSW